MKVVCPAKLQFPFKLWPKLSQHIIHRCILYWRFYGSS